MQQKTLDFKGDLKCIFWGFCIFWTNQSFFIIEAINLVRYLLPREFR